MIYFYRKDYCLLTFVNKLSAYMFHNYYSSLPLTFCSKWLLCGRLSIFVNRFIVIYSNLFRLVLEGILLSRNYNKRNSHPVLALILSCSFHIRKNTGKRLSA